MIDERYSNDSINMTTSAEDGMQQRVLTIDLTRIFGHSKEPNMKHFELYMNLLIKLFNVKNGNYIPYIFINKHAYYLFRALPYIVFNIIFMIVASIMYF